MYRAPITKRPWNVFVFSHVHTLVCTYTHKHTPTQLHTQTHTVHNSPSLSLALFARVCVYEQVADQLVTPQDDGFFTIGVLGGKTESNVGTLWRSAFQLDAKVWGE